MHPCQHIFKSLLGVSSGDETLHLTLDCITSKNLQIDPTDQSCYVSFIFHHPVFKLKYSRLLITWTFQGNQKKFESAGVWVIRSTKQITGKEEMGGEWMQVTRTLPNLINTKCWTLLYLNWTDKKVKTKNKWLLK